MSHDRYKNAFETFISHTDEKEVLCREILNEVKKYNIASLLDIGAGNGDLALPLSQGVEHYVAIEPKQSFVQRLREHDIDVIQNWFPCWTDEKFDMILSSHSIRSDEELRGRFIDVAVDLLEDTGVLLIITFKGGETNWSRFMDYLGEERGEHNKKWFDSLVSYLNQYGKVSVRNVTSYVRTDTFDEIFSCLDFVYSDAMIEKHKEFLARKEEVRAYLDEIHRDETGYFFPFTHYFITLQK